MKRLAYAWLVTGFPVVVAAGLYGCSDDGSANGGADAYVSCDGGTGQDGTVIADGSATDGGGGQQEGGVVLFYEDFEDTDFQSRGWYDGPSADLSTTEHVPGSTASFECRYEVSATGCSGGKPARHLFQETETVYLSYWVKYSANWVGSGHPYHPHEFHFVTNLDNDYVGPARTHLTTYIEQVGGVARLALQDSVNVDPNCILLNNDSFVGCNGDFDTYVFTEDRSVCSCNGLVGDLDGRDCFSGGGGNYYSSRSWSATSQTFSDSPGPNYKNDWHFVEALFSMSSIQAGVGVPDGQIRYWFDGQLTISHDHILMRTGQHPDMRFNQFCMFPYIGDGSPVDQYMWVDDLTVATGRP